MPMVADVFGNVKDFTSIVREVDFDEVRIRAETPPSIVVCAREQSLADAVIRQVFGEDAPRWVDVRTDWFDDIDPTKYDIIIAIDPHQDGLEHEVRTLLGTDADRKLIVRAFDSTVLTPVEITMLQDAVVGLDMELTPALGRRFPMLELAAVREIVNDTARANAQFALVSNVPAVIPVFGSFLAAGADFIVLTKNQVMMVFKIAAVHDRDLRDQMLVMRELAPVVGGGFLWRTAAREAVSFLPFAAGTIPKVAIAYVGTMVMGRAADYFYRFGKKPTREHLRAFADLASESVARLQIGKADELAERAEHEREMLEEKVREPA